MKKSLLQFLILLIVFNASSFAQNISVRNCGTMIHLSEQIRKDPSVLDRMNQIERQTNQFLTSKSSTTSIASATTTIVIPVVFHVIYSTSAQNITDAQCIAQINQLNLDYAKMNSDTTNTPSVFKSLAANTQIQFCLAQRDPNGLATTGIIHKSTTTTSFTSDDKVKSSTTGGDNAWPAGSYLNIWTCNLGSSLLGYAQFPGGAASTDGVVLLYSSVGSMAKPGTATPYQLGRTATHEVGHWLNLRHIWGDANCGSDLVNDTPTQQTSNSGCPTFPHVTCSNGSNGDMYMNYMDYTNDACMNMFTAGQSSRMNALFASGGARVSLLSSTGCLPVSTTCSVPSGLTSSSITSSGATLGWTAVTGAASYNVQYRLVGAASWTSTTSTTNSKSVTGLTASSNYEFQVQTVCTGGTSAFSTSATFTTTSATTTCTVPTGLTSSSITSSGATLGWTAVTGAASYNVQYRKVGTTTWTSTTITTNSKAITGLTASTSYEFQVQTVCTGGTSAFSASGTFTTSAATTTCTVPSGLAASAITSSGATLGWTSIASILSYNIRYRVVGTTTWTSTTSTTNSKSITGLVAASNYEFQIQTVCSSSLLSTFSSSANFTTASATACISTYDNTTNGAISGAAAIPFNTNITGLINTSTDIDYYKFTITTAGTITISLSTLPADFDLALVNSAGTQLASSANAGTTSESISYTAAAGTTYYVKVFGYSGALSTSSCYTLKVQLGTATRLDNNVLVVNDKVQLYPNPAHEQIQVALKNTISKSCSYIIMDAKGAVVKEQKLQTNPQFIDVSSLTKGVYLIKVNNGGVITTEKFMKQ